MWVDGNRTFFDVRLINWLAGRFGGAADEVSHEALCWVTSAAESAYIHTAVIDVRGLRPGQHHVYEAALARFAKAKHRTHRVIFLNASSEVAHAIMKEARNSAQWAATRRPSIVIVDRKAAQLRSHAGIDAAVLNAHSQSLKNRSIESLARKCCVVKRKLVQLPSSPVLANAAFYCKKFICSPLLCAAAVQSMAGHVRDLETSSASGEVTLCATSVNGAILAGYIGSLMNRHCLVLNHFGPKDKLFERRVLDFIRPNAPYVLLADYICLGTELRVARSNIENHGGAYIGAVALGALSREVASHHSLGTVRCLAYVADIARGARACIPGLGG